jgi:predicted RecB family endonuclease
MIQSVENLIKHLQNNYEPNEDVSYTLYSQADLAEVVSELGTHVVWGDIIDNFDDCFEQVQEDLNIYLYELVEEYKDNKEEEESETI